jgi:3-oxoacyl-[acyl-carrier protein] reductase
MTQGSRSDAEWQEVVASFARITIMGRVGEPDEIARAVAFLAAPEAGWITAQVLTVDGGRMDYIGHS